MNGHNVIKMRQKVRIIYFQSTKGSLISFGTIKK